MKQLTWQPQSQNFIKRYRYLIALFFIVLLSFGLDFFAISKIGYGNAYYAAAIKSMTQSFHNFFYLAFDPAGVVSVDKPPLGLWIQALFVLVFGYHGWAMLLPQALGATGATLMMYILTAKYFGRPAGLISALVCAVTPALAVAARNNTIDAQLVFCLLVATWFLFKAIETARWRSLFLAALFIGLGFNIKMLQAYMILPAVAVVYLVFSREEFRKKIVASLISLVIMAVVSFSWIAAVDLTPAADRPYVGSSTDNTEIELVVGHNGLERLTGHSSVNSAANNRLFQNSLHNITSNFNHITSGAGNTSSTTTNTATSSSRPSAPPHGGGSGQSGFGGGPQNGFGNNQTTVRHTGVTGNEIGNAGVFRLWSDGLYGQISWLLIFTLFCVAAKLRRVNIHQLTLRQGVFAYWGIWLLTMVVFFSFAGFYHRYYLCMLAPGIAGLAGPGLVAMIEAFKARHPWKRFLLPLSLIATTGVAAVYVAFYTALQTWLLPLIIVAAVLALLLMALYALRPRRLIMLAATALMLVSLLAAPFYWSLTTVLYVPQNSTMPYAGPELADSSAIIGMTSNQETLTTGDSDTLALEQYLVDHYKEGSYLVVARRANDVAQFIVNTGLPAVAYGGFLGTDGAITLEEFKELVAQGKITYVLITSAAANQYAEITQYVEENATLIDPSAYGVDDSDTTYSVNGISGSALYHFGSDQ